MRADFRVTTWLNALSPITSALGRPESPGPVPAQTGMKNLDVLALLIAKNGFIANPQGWGRFEGPFGLTFGEFRVLLEMGTYLQGLVDGAGLNSIATLETYLQPALMKLADEFEKAESPAVALVEGGTDAADTVEVPTAVGAEDAAPAP